MNRKEESSMVMSGGCVQHLNLGSDDGPCDCNCHKDGLGAGGAKHVIACCSYSGMPRAQAKAEAFRRKTAREGFADTK
ncbi:MAG: hypothetical protein ISR99_01660 [Parcubacteria group bacterium]|nr:hypothetical protein [Parcubacteria group bacterium]